MKGTIASKPIWQNLSKMSCEIATLIFNSGWEPRLRNNASDVFRLNFFSCTAFFFTPMLF